MIATAEFFFALLGRYPIPQCTVNEFGVIRSEGSCPICALATAMGLNPNGERVLVNKTNLAIGFPLRDRLILAADGFLGSYELIGPIRSEFLRILKPIPTKLKKHSNGTHLVS